MDSINWHSMKESFSKSYVMFIANQIDYADGGIRYWRMSRAMLRCFCSMQDRDWANTPHLSMHAYSFLPRRVQRGNCGSGNCAWRSVFAFGNRWICDYACRSHALCTRGHVVIRKIRYKIMNWMIKIEYHAKKYDLLCNCRDVVVMRRMQ